jgi:hypothetical protein
MEPIKFKGEIKRGSGYGFISFPRELLDASDTVRVRVTVNGNAYVEDARALQSGEYMLVFNREQLRDMNVKYGQNVSVEVERVDAPPQLSDLPADMLLALTNYAVEEDFKRLPPDEQKAKLCEVEEAGSTQERMERIEAIAQQLKREEPDLPRGESL